MEAGPIWVGDEIQKVFDGVPYDGKVIAIENELNADTGEATAVLLCVGAGERQVLGLASFHYGGTRKPAL